MRDCQGRLGQLAGLRALYITACRELRDVRALSILLDLKERCTSTPRTISELWMRTARGCCRRWHRVSKNDAPHIADLRSALYAMVALALLAGA